MKLNDLVLNCTLYTVAAAAVAMVSVRIHERFWVVPVDGTQPHRIQAWRDYSVEGQRMGFSGAPVTVVEFSDFQCPYCKKAWQDLQDIRKEHPNAVAVVFRNFPLSIHKFAEGAAVAAECAARQGAFEPS